MTKTLVATLVIVAAISQFPPYVDLRMQWHEITGARSAKSL